jgi:hypothetical protein
MPKSKPDPFKTPDGKPISNAIEQWNDLSAVILPCLAAR